jgi:hypothetical protein
MIPLICAISGSGLLSILIQLIVAGLIFWLLLWLLTFVGLPEPFLKVAKVILAVVAVIFVINLLLSLTGSAFIQW